MTSRTNRPGGAKRKITRQKSVRGNMTTSCIVMARSQTIRGKRGGVKKQLNQMQKNIEADSAEITPLMTQVQLEKDHSKLVLYLTTVGTVRQTKLDCEKLKQMLYVVVAP
jgi:hypothetical protein